MQNARMSSHTVAIVAVLGAILGGVCPAHATDWPCFHGPARDNKSPDTGLLKSWPESGPSLVWEASGLGEGYSSVSIADGRVYTAGTQGGVESVLAIDMKGKRLWRVANGGAWTTDKSWAKAYTGARSTPTFDNGRVYHLGATGRLAAFDAASGTEVWAIDLRKKYGAPLPDYGFSESVLIEGDRLYCSPAGTKAFIVCLDKNTGDQIWATTGVGGEAGFNSLVPGTHNGRRVLFSTSSQMLFSVDAESGRIIWSTPFANKRDNNIADPVYHDGYVFATSGYGRGSMLVKLVPNKKATTPQVVWDTTLMDNHHGGVVLHDGHLYGSGHESRGWYCLDFLTGAEKWKSAGKGALTYANGMLFLLEEKGTVKLAAATPESYSQSGAFKVPSGGKGMYWAHPVVCGGRLYVRHADKLFVYAVK